MQAYKYNTTDIQEDVINTYYRRRNTQKRAERRRREKIYFIKQKLLGFGMVLYTIYSFFLEDATFGIFASIFFLPMGIYAMITKEKVLMIR